MIMPKRTHSPTTHDNWLSQKELLNKFMLNEYNQSITKGLQNLGFGVLSFGARLLDRISLDSLNLNGLLDINN